jgi:hypothetical protein
MAAHRLGKLTAVFDILQHAMNDRFESGILGLILNGCQRIHQGRTDFQH